VVHRNPREAKRLKKKGRNCWTSLGNVSFERKRSTRVVFSVTVTVLIWDRRDWRERRNCKSL